MQYSKLFGKTQKNVPQKFESKNHELLTKAGFIDQVASGIFTLLPLGKQVLTKIENIIREEMNKIGGQEVLMPSLHPKTYWEKTDRWNTVDVLFKTKSRFGNDYGLAPTHEEIVTPLAKKYIHSYRDLPLYLYHITSKFRDEPRPKSGILRGREFGMKDLYSFHKDSHDLQRYYKTVTDAYLKIFSRCGLTEIKITQASGGSFTKKFSHEFNVITPAGEVDLLHCDRCSFAQNTEVTKLKKDSLCSKCKQGKLKAAKAIEVGNIFDLGTKFSNAFEFKYTGENGQLKPIIMGCYGIGTTRLLGTVVEIHYDDKGIIWPKNITPYKSYLVGLDLKNKEVNKIAFDIYDQLKKANVEILFDDRIDVSAGEKFVDADLIGIPVRLIISKRTGSKIEYKERDDNKSELLTLGEILNKL